MALVTFFFIVLALLVVLIKHWRTHHPPSVPTATNALLKLNQNIEHQKKHVPARCESTLLLMRHCEKAGITQARDGSEHCSYLGFERAKYLASLFPRRWPTPTHLYAYMPERSSHSNFREIETLQPLAQQSSINIDVSKTKALHKEFFDLLQAGSVCGQVAVACWKHEQIPLLAATLGCGPEQGCPTFYPDDEFDQVWSIKFVFSPPDPSDTESPSKRFLKKSSSYTQQEGWQVFGTVVRQNFDPLQYSASVGDYMGSGSGGRWRDEEDNDL